MKKGSLVAAALGAGLLLSAVGAGAVSADNSVTGTYGGLTRITVSYASSGNVLSVTDIRNDGYGGRSFWSTSPAGLTGIKDNSSGNGTTTTTEIPGSSGTVAFNSCVKNGSTTIACTSNVSSSL